MPHLFFLWEAFVLSYRNSDRVLPSDTAVACNTEEEDLSALGRQTLPGEFIASILKPTFCFLQRTHTCHYNLLLNIRSRWLVNCPSMNNCTLPHDFVHGKRFLLLLYLLFVILIFGLCDKIYIHILCNKWRWHNNNLNHFVFFSLFSSGLNIQRVFGASVKHLSFSIENLFLPKIISN